MNCSKQFEARYLPVILYPLSMSSSTQFNKNSIIRRGWWVENSGVNRWWPLPSGKEPHPHPARNRPAVTMASTAMPRLDVMKLLGAWLARVLGGEAADSAEDEEGRQIRAWVAELSSSPGWTNIGSSTWRTRNNSFNDDSEAHGSSDTEATHPYWHT